MILLSSILKNHIVLNCRCGHVGMICVADLIVVYGGNVDVGTMESEAHCSKCKTKSIDSTQIIYVGSSRIALQSADSGLPKND